MLRNSLIASALVCAFAAVPFTQTFAQDANPQAQKAESNETVPDKAADAWITTKVKSELATAKHVKASDINVETDDSIVTLTGTVATKNEKSRAVKLAKSVKGVKSVNASGLTVSAMRHADAKTSDMPASSASAGH
jgi:hyperosmotically inducible protein